MTAREARIGLIAFSLLLSGLAFNLLAVQPPPQPGATRLTTEKTFMAPDRPRRGGETGQTAAPKSAPPQAGKSLEPESVETVRAIQRELRSRGYETGGTDGMASLMTRAAIMAYEHDHGAAPSGDANEDVLRFILLGDATGKSPGKGERRPNAEAVVRSIQQSLAGLGYNPGRVDGVMRPDTAQAIREFEKASALPVTGRISGPLVGKLVRSGEQMRKPDAR